ncbi:transmembrane protein 225B isoform X5 [Ursus maritimus]|uniref:Transmembrane protein 225B isoform X5 n=1 Tax=Ursus maritimus TaxID=29073 RepID=A0A8M1GFN5_URSMA|nr:transmembrane protein 225B isoform X5 [Ursus maritimus]
MAELEFEFIRPAPDRFHSHPVRLTGEQGPHGKQPRRPGTGSEGQVSGGRGRRASYQEPASSCLFSSLNRSRWPKLGMGRPVMLTLQDKDVKGFTWAIAPALTSLGYLLILLVSVFPFWVRLVNEESHEVFFSGLFENCFHIKCWKPRPLSGVCAFLALLLHALEIQNLRMKPSPPQFSVQWPYYVLGFAIVLFIVAGAVCLFQETACFSCHWLPNSRSIEETQGVPHLENLESLGGDLSSIQKETLLKEETII